MPCPIHVCNDLDKDILLQIFRLYLARSCYEVIKEYILFVIIMLDHS